MEFIHLDDSFTLDAQLTNTALGYLRMKMYQKWFLAPLTPSELNELWLHPTIEI